MEVEPIWRHHLAIDSGCNLRMKQWFKW